MIAPFAELESDESTSPAAFAVTVAVIPDVAVDLVPLSGVVRFRVS